MGLRFCLLRVCLIFVSVAGGLMVCDLWSGWLGLRADCLGAFIVCCLCCRILCWAYRSSAEVLVGCLWRGWVSVGFDWI